MDKTNSKILTLSYAITGALCGLTLHMLIKSFSAAFGVVARLADSDLVRHGLPVVFGLVVFLFLQLSPGINAWAQDVVSEIRKVVWPTRKETTSMTIVVLIMVLVSSAMISTFDLLSGAIMKWIMGS
jgi:preprotein translocase subunit SecE